MMSETLTALSEEDRLFAYIVQITRPGLLSRQIRSDPSNAQETVDKMHHWLRSYGPHPLREKVLGMLQTIVYNTGILPGSMMLHDVIRASSMIATSNISVVFRGKHGARDVAVKELKLNELGYKYFVREAITWAHAKHPYILELDGVFKDPSLPLQPLLVSAYMQNGNLATYVKDNPAYRGRRMQLASQIAQGLYYLRCMNIVHGDIKDTNILIGEEHQALITDFGLAIIGDSTQAGIFTATGVRGSSHWMAPERFGKSADSARRKFPMDVYSYGCLCYMLCTGHAPFWQHSDIELERLILQEKARPFVPAYSVDGTTVDDSFRMLITECWAHNPSKRYGIANVMAYFGVDLRGFDVWPVRFVTRARRDLHGSGELDSTMDVRMRKGDTVYVSNCETEPWVARTLSGDVGFVPYIKEDPYLHLPVLMTARAILDYTPSADERIEGMCPLPVEEGERIQIISFGTDGLHWIARRWTDEENIIGVVRSEHLRPEWPVLTSRTTGSLEVKAPLFPCPYHDALVFSPQIDGSLTGEADNPIGPDWKLWHLEVAQMYPLVVWNFHPLDRFCIAQVLPDHGIVARTGLMPRNFFLMA